MLYPSVRRCVIGKRDQQEPVVLKSIKTGLWVIPTDDRDNRKKLSIDLQTTAVASLVTDAFFNCQKERHPCESGLTRNEALGVDLCLEQDSGCKKTPTL